jgi:hypothetical protein
MEGVHKNNFRQHQKLQMQFCYLIAEAHTISHLQQVFMQPVSRFIGIYLICIWLIRISTESCSKLN